MPPSNQGQQGYRRHRVHRLGFDFSDRITCAWKRPILARCTSFAREPIILPAVPRRWRHEYTLAPNQFSGPTMEANPLGWLNRVSRFGSVGVKFRSFEPCTLTAGSWGFSLITLGEWPP